MTALSTLRPTLVYIVSELIRSHGWHWTAWTIQGRLEKLYVSSEPRIVGVIQVNYLIGRPYSAGQDLDITSWNPDYLFLTPSSDTPSAEDQLQCLLGGRTSSLESDPSPLHSGQIHSLPPGQEGNRTLAFILTTCPNRHFQHPQVTASDNGAVTSVADHFDAELLPSWTQELHPNIHLLHSPGELPADTETSTAMIVVAPNQLEQLRSQTLDVGLLLPTILPTPTKTSDNPLITPLFVLHVRHGYAKIVYPPPHSAFGLVSREQGSDKPYILDPISVPPTISGAKEQAGQAVTVTGRAVDMILMINHPYTVAWILVLAAWGARRLGLGRCCELALRYITRKLSGMWAGRSQRAAEVVQIEMDGDKAEPVDGGESVFSGSVEDDKAAATIDALITAEVAVYAAGSSAENPRSDGKGQSSVLAPASSSADLAPPKGKFEFVSRRPERRHSMDMGVPSPPLWIDRKTTRRRLFEASSDSRAGSGWQMIGGTG